MSAPKLNDQLRAEYNRRFTSAVITKSRIPAVSEAADAVKAGRARYERVADQTGVPWWLIGIIHNLECNSSWTKHLHNGDSLARRTHRKPAGRPPRGTPPFDWEFSAVDAVQYDGLHRWKDWSLPGCLYKLEAFNGFGSRKRGVATAYLWSFSDQYRRGKFIKDNVWSPTAISKQVGAALILKTLVAQGVVTFPA